MAEEMTPDAAAEPAWRERAVSRSLQAARTRAEKRVQRFMDAAFELIDEKGTTDFTIQEVIDIALERKPAASNGTRPAAAAAKIGRSGRKPSAREVSSDGRTASKKASRKKAVKKKAAKARK